MITVGIQDNIRVQGVSLNDQGTLILDLQQDAGGGAGGILDQLSSTSSSTQENDQGYYFWPIKDDERLSAESEKFKDVLNKLKTFRAELNHILEQYMVSTAISWNPIQGLGFKSETDLTNALMSSATREGVLAKMYNNYATQFIAMLTPHVGPASPLFRVKFVRTSKDKHFSSLPKFAPFMEPMSIDKKASKLVYTRYELGFRKGDPEKGPYSGTNYADGTPTPGAGATAAAGNPDEAKAHAALFGE